MRVRVGYHWALPVSEDKYLEASVAGHVMTFTNICHANMLEEGEARLQRAGSPSQNRFTCGRTGQWEGDTQLVQRAFLRYET